MIELSSFQVGASAPDVVLHANDGATFTLARFWQDQSLLVFFMRHFGCATCRQHMFQLRKIYPAIQTYGGRVLGIAMHDPDMVARYVETHQLPFPVFADPERVSYQAFNVGEGSHWETAGPMALLHQFKETAQGNTMALPTSVAESKQLGGTCIIDRRGIVQFAHVARPTYQYPAVVEYLAVFERLRQNRAILA